MDSTAYHVTVRKAAELLDLDLPSKTVKSNLLTEVLISAPSRNEPLLPLHEAVVEPVLQVWGKTCDVSSSE